MSVTAPAGFRAAGATAGLKASGRPDVALVVNDGPHDAVAAVFTTNRCKANPVLWSERVVADGRARAVVLNSGGANCFTGPQGFQTTHATAEGLAELLGIGAGDVVVCSTGLIGEQLDRQRLLAGVGAAVGALATDDDAALAAATAVMTTDTRPKQVLVQRDGWSVGGLAKGAGMLSPALATMLCVLTTDAVVEAPVLDEALRAAVRTTLERVDTDGCTSTNDAVVLLSSGASGRRPGAEELTAALTEACADLARQLVADAEGAEHEVAVVVGGAASEDDALEVARAVARNALVKTALFGRDPNWGRVLAAVGTTAAAFEPSEVDVVLNGVAVCRAGQPGEPRELVDLSGRQVTIEVDLHAGDERATIWTTDLTHAYVHENSAYST